jgi:hypothetical protein
MRPNNQRDLARDLIEEDADDWLFQRLQQIAQNEMPMIPESPPTEVTQGPIGNRRVQLPPTAPLSPEPLTPDLQMDGMPVPRIQDEEKDEELDVEFAEIIRQRLQE